ncbi:S-layer homology domain-containing protein, partial [Bacillus cereus]|nr:S-layer homology domain-containing protein [Bacillus cereus]
CILLFSTLGTTFAEQNSQGNSLSFIDVPKTHWAYKEMMYMAENKIITGYGNGYFGAADPITREHLAAFLYRYLKPQDSTNNPFVDIGDSNFNKEILALTARGIFSVNAEKRFNPKNNMTRAEMATVLVKAFNLKPQGNFEFTDMKGHWANEYVKILAGNNITSGTGDGNFNPNGIVTREQFSMFLYRTIMKVTDMENNESVATYKEYVIQRPTLLYSEPSYLKQANDSIHPRTVTVTEEKGNGWKKIKTQNGEKWVAPEGQKYNLQVNVKMYLKPSIEEKSTGVLGAQMVTLLDEQPDGWKKVLTDNGTRWIAPEGINYKVENSQTLYSSPDYKSKTVGSIASQTVKVVDFQQNGWLKIKSHMGDTWIAPKGVTYELKQNVAMYREPSFLADKEEYGLIPQKVILLEDRPNGWKRIKTAYGDRWIVPDGIPYQIAKPTQLYRDYGFTDHKGTIASEIVTVIGEQPGGWYQIKSSKGQHWIAPNGIKYRTTKAIDFSASKDILSSKLGVIPKDTVITVVDIDKILWNGQYVYGFLTYFSMELVEETKNKYIQQPTIYASLPQIQNIVTNGHDDGISEQAFNNISNWKFTFDIQDINIPDLSIPDLNIPDLNISDIGIPDLNIPNLKFNIDLTDFNIAMKEMEQINTKLKDLNLEKANKVISDALRLANGGMQQMIQGVNQANSGLQGMNGSIRQANEGMVQMKNGVQQMIQGVNQANSGLQGMNNAVDQANEGMQQMLNATNKMQKGLEKTISGIDVSVKEINSVIDAPNKAPQSDLKTIHLDFDFSNIVPTSSPEEKLRQQQRDEAMYNILAGMPFTGNLVSLGELISGKNLNSEEDLKAPDYAINMLAVLGGGEIKAGAAFFGSISKVTKRQKLTTTKVDLSWLERFGDKYQAVEVTGTAKVLKQTSILDRRVYQMKDIDWNYVSSNPQAKGLSNLELAKKGRSPFYKDDTQIQLHHTTQREAGSMVELPASKHRKYSKQLHGTIEDGESFRNDPVLTAQYERFRDYYWKQRAQDYQK